MHVVLGFTVEIQNAGTGSDVDSAWETCTGGSLNIEVSDSSTGSDQFHTTTPGHKYIDSLTLRGPLTAGRKALCQWITEVVQGKGWKRTVSVKEIKKDGSDGKTFSYMDCFPTRYVFPAFSASGTGNLYEEVSIKPIRLELMA
jgi:phage tail-like protein